MDVNEDELIGTPSKGVPTLEPTDEDCLGKRTEKPDDETIFIGFCRSTPGRGTDHVGEGRCKHHGGCNGGDNGQGAPEGNDNADGNDGGASEDNTNAVKHGAYADHNRFYNQVLDDPLRALADDIFADYIEKYRASHGEPPCDARYFSM